jgi:hypothetical protein
MSLEFHLQASIILEGRLRKATAGRTGACGFNQQRVIQSRPVIKITGYLYKVHLRGLHPWSHKQDGSTSKISSLRITIL